MIIFRLLGSSYSNGFMTNESGVLNMREEDSGPFCISLNILGIDV